MMPSPQGLSDEERPARFLIINLDSNGGEMQPYTMRNIPPGMGPGLNPVIFIFHRPANLLFLNLSITIHI
jgi:hypothetical protein